MDSVKNADFEHTGPGRPAGHLLRQCWQPVYLAEDLPPGRAVPLKILHEELTLYRGEDGAAHIIAGRCAHRGVLLSVGIVEDDCVRCRYHGWQYDQSGQCVDQPAEPKSFAAKVKIASYPVEEYFGFIWIYLGESPVPELPRWPELDDRTADFTSSNCVSGITSTTLRTPSTTCISSGCMRPASTRMTRMPVRSPR